MTSTLGSYFAALVRLYSLWLDAVKDLLQGDSSVFDTEEVDKYQETWRRKYRNSQAARHHRLQLL